MVRKSFVSKLLRLYTTYGFISVTQVALLLCVASESGDGHLAVNTSPSALDTALMVITVIGLYDYVVTDFGNPFLLLKTPP